MKRAHRRLHLVLWFALAPALAAVLWLALTERQSMPVYDTLPDVLTESAS